ncbi:MAG: tetratricopeptide repeat protein [Acidobacteria bacterium]|nr:tetratricopeptide repeat protein [Acidobacteriota bacterium]
MNADLGPVVRETERLIESGRPDLAIAAFQQLVREQPAEAPSSAMLADRLVEAADAAAASGRCADALAYLSVVANWRAARGDSRGAADLRERMEGLELADLEAQLNLAHGDTAGAPPGDPPSAAPARFDPPAAVDMRLPAQRARAFVARGDARGAAEHLLADMAGGDATLLLAIAEIQLRAGQLDRGMALVESVIQADPLLGDDVVRLGIDLASRQADAGFLMVEMAADAWAAGSQWQKAALAFEQFVTRHPDYVPARVRLHETEEAAARAIDEARVVSFRPHRTA